MSRTRFNKNGTVSITGISLDLYYGIQKIVSAAESAFVDPKEDDGEYHSNNDFVCSLSQEEKDALEKEWWCI